jgi:hypothetical protein
MPIKKTINKKRRLKLKKRNKTFKRVNCGPSIAKKDFTCYSDSALIKLRNTWNMRHPDARINSNNSREIWNSLKLNMDDVCDTESCWLRQKFIDGNLDKELSTYTFAPKSPSTWKTNKNQWLTSIDIEKVMKQYENAYSCFQFIGPSPIDFDSPQIYGECVWEELCKFELKNYIKNGKTKLGFIFNTDPHYMSGSHWISMFVNIKKKYIYFFDSNGDKCPPQITQLQERIKSQGTSLGINFEILSNYPKTHQKSNTECGMYSLYLIIQLLTDTKDHTYFNQYRIKDSEVESLRKEYFNEDL